MVVMSSSLQPNSSGSKSSASPHQSVPLHQSVAIAWGTGLLFGYLSDLAIAPLLCACLLLHLGSLVLLKSASKSWRTVALLMVVVLAGACRWEIWQAPHRDPFAASSGQLNGTFQGTIHSVPVVYRRPESPWSISYGSSERTTFELQVDLSIEQSQISRSEIWQVSLDGNARGRLSCGDAVTVQGRAVRPSKASNPGQFDFRQQLRSRGVSRQLFVNHFSAIQVNERAAWWNPYRWASWLRADAERILDASLAGPNQQLAVAMFLGNRSQLPYELRDAFVASGTMHLLAISGLHVGILSLFVVRMFHVLGVSRGMSLLAMMVVICGYAMVTGFRPSVVRATLFLLLFGTSQLLGRQQRLLDLLSLTALIMTVWSPGLLVDTGAWLSFLSVGALAWYSNQTGEKKEDRDVPEDQRSITRMLQSGIGSFWKQLLQRYRQMLSILLFTLPLTTSEFHVLSAVSLLVNVLLILYTFVVLAAGYLTLFVGVLLPVAGWIPASVFSLFLSVFSVLVNWASELPCGHFYLSDFPVWFLPLWYGALVAMVASRVPVIRRGFVVLLILLAVAGFGTALNEPHDAPLTVTVLDIGHGSAAVVECGGRVMLVDSGSLNQARRAAEVVSGFLWNRGWNHIDQVVISHADSDHYNAVPTLISRFPIGQIITSKEFTKSTDKAIQALMRFVQQEDIDIRIVDSNTRALLATGELQILQPNVALLPTNASDNETSLVVKVMLGRTSVLLPGDLEQRGLQQLLPSLGRSTVLVSPHHGSRLSNPAELASSVSPALVVVSAHDTASRKHLENVYSDAKAVWWTSESGAVQLEFCEGWIQATGFHSEPYFNLSCGPAND